MLPRDWLVQFLPELELELELGTSLEAGIELDLLRGKPSERSSLSSPIRRVRARVLGLTRLGLSNRNGWHPIGTSPPPKGRELRAMASQTCSLAEDYRDG